MIAARNWLTVQKQEFSRYGLLQKRLQRPYHGEFLFRRLTEAAGPIGQAEISRKCFGLEDNGTQISKWFRGSGMSPGTLRAAAKFIHSRSTTGVSLTEFSRDFFNSYTFLRRYYHEEVTLKAKMPNEAKLFLIEVGVLTGASVKPYSYPSFITKEKAFAEDPIVSIWLNPHNHYSIPLTGRQAEWELLDEFVHRGDPFLVAAMIAPSGAGKTRLVSEWMKQYISGNNDKGWDAGFATSSDRKAWTAENWTPCCNTLIIVDYIYNYGEVMRLIMERFKDGAPHKIRLLVLDHVLPMKLPNDIGWKGVFPSQSFREGRDDLFFKPFPLELKPASDDTGLLRTVIANAADPHTEAKRYNRDSPEVWRTVEALLKIGSEDRKASSPDEQRRRNAIRHPLFAALMGQMLGKNSAAEFVGMSRRDLISHYFENERRLPWSVDATDPILGFWVGFLVSASTLLRGVSKNDILHFQDSLPGETSHFPIGNDFHKVLSICSRFVSADTRLTIKPLEPDILGEAFILSFLSNNGSGKNYQSFATALVNFSQSEQSKDQIGSFLEAMQRLVRNLINDDQDLLDVEEAWGCLFRLLDPKWFDGDKEFRQAISIALGDLIQQVNATYRTDYLEKFLQNIDISDLEGSSFGHRWQSALTSAIYCLDALVQLKIRDAPKLERLCQLVAKTRVHFGGVCPPSHLAISVDALNAAKQLMEAFNTDINCCDSNGWSGLMLACHYGHKDTVDWLLGNSADPNYTEQNEGLTPLMIACSQGHLDLAKALHNNGASIRDVQSVNHWSAAMFAAANGHIPILSWLRSEYVDLSAATPIGDTLAMAAGENGHLDVLRWLYVQQIDISTPNELGWNVVYAASARGQLAVLEWLADRRISFQAQMVTGESPVTFAAFGGHCDVVRWLHTHGVNVHAETVFGDTALSLAREAGHDDIVKYIEGLSSD